MAEIQIINPACDDDDCEGARGERGKRGRRGHHGHDGHDGAPGAPGATGATGPAGSIGATGPTGTTGAGLTAYAHAVGQRSMIISANGTVDFDLGATPFPNVGFTVVPPPGGNVFVVATTGDYEYDFYIAGVPSTGTSLEFALDVNGIVQGPAHEFRSNFSATAGDVLVVRGQGIILLTAGDVVALRNRTLSGVDTVSVTSAPPGGEAGANVTTTFKKLN